MKTNYDPNIKDPSVNSTFHLFSRVDGSLLIQLLKNKPINNIELKNNIGNTVLHEFATEIDSDFPNYHQILSQLLKIFGNCLNIQNNQGKTVLMLICQQNSLELETIKLIL